MRKRLEPQLVLGQLLIEDTSTLRSRDGMVSLVIGLRELHRNKVLPGQATGYSGIQVGQGQVKHRTSRDGAVDAICSGSASFIQGVELR